MKKKNYKKYYKIYLEWFYTRCSGFLPYNYKDFVKRFKDDIDRNPNSYSTRVSGFVE